MLLKLEWADVTLRPFLTHTKTLGVTTLAAPEGHSV